MNTIKTNKAKKYLIFIAVTILLWELIGNIINSTVFPPLSKTLVSIYNDRNVIFFNICPTLYRVLIGFVLGNLLAVILGIISFFIKPFYTFISTIIILVYAVPVVLFTPIIGSYWNDSINFATIFLAVILILYPTYIGILTGLQNSSPELIRLIKVNGGNTFQIFYHVQLPMALPSILAVLGFSVTASFLGVLLGEYLLGGRVGIGYYLKSIMPIGDQSKIWGITIVITSICWLIFRLFDNLGNRIAKKRSLKQEFKTRIRRNAKINKTYHFRRSLFKFASILIGLSLFITVWSIIGNPEDEIVIKSPCDIYEYLFNNVDKAETWTKIIKSSKSTIFNSIIGLFLGLTLAVILAILSIFFPTIQKLLNPTILISQTMPLLIFIPFISVLCGKEDLSILLISISVCFFPAYLEIYAGFQLLPKAYFDLYKAFGGNKFGETFRLYIPFSLPYLFTAAKLIAPKVLTGVILAEMLLTNTGIGGLFYLEKGKPNFNLIWSLGVLATLFSGMLFVIMAVFEKIFNKNKI